MKRNRNNLVIVMLLGVLTIMAVAYAGFATTLTISGTATATGTWNVHFNQSVTSGSGTGTADPISYSNTANGMSATLSVDLEKPGDTYSWILDIYNEGSVGATLSAPVITNNGTTVGTGNTRTSGGGHIQLTVGNIVSSSAGTGSQNLSLASSSHRYIKVTATFLDTATITSMTSGETASITININATQA